MSTIPQKQLLIIFYLLLMKLMASYAFSTFTMGKMGPKISSCMIGSVGFTSTRIVGEMYLQDSTPD